MRSPPRMMANTSPRSQRAMSSSEVRCTANSNAKLGAGENARELLASNRIHRDGCWMNEIGPVNTVWSPARIGAHNPMKRPMLCDSGTQETTVVSGGGPLPYSEKYADITCPKLVSRLFCVTITPVGRRVEPD